MKRSVLVLSTVVAVIGAFALGRAGAQEGPTRKKTPQEEMAAWMALAKTGPEHAQLMKSVGKWTCECKMWMEPGGEPSLATGKATFSSVLGDRFLKQDYDGTFMGQPDLAIGYVGFNNATKKYEAIWLSNMGTGVVIMTGTETEPGVCAYEGTCAGPGGEMMKHRLILKHVGNDKQIIEMFMTPAGGAEFKHGEMIYTRSK